MVKLTIHQHYFGRWVRAYHPAGDRTLHWRHNERNGVSNHRRLDCLLNRLFRCRSKKTLKLRVTGLCEGNSPVIGEFPAQRASNAQNVSIWWRHHDITRTNCDQELWPHSVRDDYQTVVAGEIISSWDLKKHTWKLVVSNSGEFVIFQNKLSICIYLMIYLPWLWAPVLDMSWWRLLMGMFSALLALCVWNSPVTGEFPSQIPVTRSFNVFFDLRLNEWLSKQSRDWWSETPSYPLWRHSNVIASTGCKLSHNTK